MKTKLLIATLAATFAVHAHADNISITDGTIATSTGGNAVNIGAGSQARFHSNHNGTAIGYNAKSFAGGTAIGEDATVETRPPTGGAAGEAVNAVAVGKTAIATNRGAMALGSSTQATGYDSSAVGVVSAAHGHRAAAFGAYAHVEGKAEFGTALGSHSRVKDNANHSVALGYNSSVEAANSVALGSGSQANTGDIVNEEAKFTGTTIHDANKGVVSVGSAGYERRIINVQDGVKDTDAVNVRQVQKVQTDLETKINAITTGGSLGSRMDALEGRMDNLNARLDNVSRTANDGAALALATAGLVAPPVGKSGLVVGTGFYRGSNALAVGYAYTGDSWGIKATGSAAGRGNFGGSLSGGIFW